MAAAASDGSRGDGVGSHEGQGEDIVEIDDEGGDDGKGKGKGGGLEVLRRQSPRLLERRARCSEHIAADPQYWLSVSRAFGDYEFKRPGAEVVSVVPDIRVMELGETDSVLVIASDGVFDVLSNDQVRRVLTRRARFICCGTCQLNTQIFAWKKQFNAGHEHRPAAPWQLQSCNKGNTEGGLCSRVGRQHHCRRY